MPIFVGIHCEHICISKERNSHAFRLVAQQYELADYSGLLFPSIIQIVVDESRVDAFLYVDAFRRLWYLLIGSIIIVTGGLLLQSRTSEKGNGPIGSISSPYSEKVDLLIVNQTMGLTPLQQSTDDISKRMQSTDILQLIESKTGSKSSVIFTAENEHLGIVVSATNQEAAKTVTDELIVQITNYRAEAIKKSAIFALGVSQEELKSLKVQIGELDLKIASAENSAVVALVTLDRMALIPKVNDLTKQISTLNGILENATGQVDVTTRVATEPDGLFTPKVDARLDSWSSTTRAVVFGIALGLLLGIALVILAMMFDKKFRRAGDLPLIAGDVQILGGVCSDASEADLRNLNLAISKKVLSSGLTGLRLISASPGIDLQILKDAIDDSLLNNCLIESLDSVDQLDPLDSTLSLKTGIIVTVELGKTNKIDISKTIKILQRADQNLIGLVAIAASQRMLSALYK